MKAEWERNAAELSCGIYEYPGFPTIEWDYRVRNADISYGIKKINGVDYVVVEGTYSVQGWIDNFQVETVQVPGLGAVHAGFYKGTELAWKDIAQRTLTSSFVISGHSRGAAQASILTAIAAREGFPPLARIVFGEPLSGTESLAAVLQDIPSRSYCNGWDPICDLPPAIACLLPFRRAGVLTRMNIKPLWNDPWPEPFSHHHMQYYRAGLLALTAISL